VSGSGTCRARPSASAPRCRAPSLARSPRPTGLRRKPDPRRWSTPSCPSCWLALIEGFTAVARRAIAEGADLVIPAEGVLNEVLQVHGVREIEGATVMDCVGAAFLQAELQVNAQRRLRLSVGRRWAYPRPPPEILARLHEAHRALAGRSGLCPATTVRSACREQARVSWRRPVRRSLCVVVTAQVDDGGRLPDQHKAKHDR